MAKSWLLNVVPMKIMQINLGKLLKARKHVCHVLACLEAYWVSAGPEQVPWKKYPGRDKENFSASKEILFISGHTDSLGEALRLLRVFSSFWVLELTRPDKITKFSNSHKKRKSHCSKIMIRLCSCSNFGWNS